MAEITYGSQGIVIERLTRGWRGALVEKGIAEKALEEQARMVRVPLKALNEMWLPLDAQHLVEAALRALEGRG